MLNLKSIVNSLFQVQKISGKYLRPTVCTPSTKPTKEKDGKSAKPYETISCDGHPIGFKKNTKRIKNYRLCKLLTIWGLHNNCCLRKLE